MLRSITIDDVNDTTASGLIEEARRQGVSVERVAGQLLQRGRRIMILMRWRAHGAKTTLQPSCRASLTSSRWIIRYGREGCCPRYQRLHGFQTGHARCGWTCSRMSLGLGLTVWCPANC